MGSGAVEYPYARYRKCRVNAGIEVYNSVYKAFLALGLDVSKHQTFRWELKRTKAGSKTYEEGGKSYHFELVPTVSADGS